MVRPFDPAQAQFRVQEVVSLVDVEILVVPAVPFRVELVVDAGGLVTDMAVLQVSECLEVVGKGVSSFQISASVKL